MLDSHGNQYLAERCHSEHPDASACCIVQRGFTVNFRIVSLEFLVYLSRVQQLVCQTRRRHFHITPSHP